MPSNECMDAQKMHAEIMNSLCARHEPLLGLLANRPLHYLDVPMYGNVGDLLIMAGTLSFFERFGLSVQRKAMYFNFPSDAAPSGATLVFQGGGNFGDIYGPFQNFRQRLITERRDCRIVVLPQTLHFVTDSAWQECIRICSQHPDLHICVRDTRSEGLARQLTPNVYLMPDMAHQLWPDFGQGMPRGQGTLFLRRRDAEAPAAGTGDGAFDWDDLVSPSSRFVLSQIERSVTQVTLRLRLAGLFGNWFADWWIGRAQALIGQSVKLFLQHERVESDRLHAHILSCLLSMSHVVLDNSYGKNSSYMDAWTGNSPLVTRKV